jgi:hypothetical protein
MEQIELNRNTELPTLYSNKESAPRIKQNLNETNIIKMQQT